MNNYISNIKKIKGKCLKFGVKNVFLSGLFYTTRVDVSWLERVHILNFDFHKNDCFIYIDNTNIRSYSL